MNFLRNGKFLWSWKGLIIVQLAVLIFSCSVPKTVSEDKKDVKDDPQPVPSSTVAVITSNDETVLRASKFANKGFTAIEFKSGHRVKQIEAGAFKDNKLTKLVLPSSITHIGKDAFRGNPITEITLSDTGIDIAEGAFATTEESITLKFTEIPDTLKLGDGNPVLEDRFANIFGKKEIKLEIDPTVTDPAKKLSIGAYIAKAEPIVLKINELLTVTFNSNGGSLINPVFVRSGGTVAKPDSSPTKDGKKFVDWYSDSEKTTQYTFSSTVTEDITLYAKWKAAVTVSAINFSGTPTTNDVYTADEAIKVTVTFSENVNVAGSGTPQIAITIGALEKQAIYESGTGTTELVFSYTVKNGDEDVDGIEIKANKLSLSGGTIQNQASKDAVLLHSAVGIDSARKVDAKGPTIRSVAFHGTPQTGGIYKTGENIEVAVTFNEDLYNTIDGDPYIMVTIGSEEKRAGSYGMGSAKNVLIFKYTVKEGDEDADGIEIKANKFALDGGNILDEARNALTDESHSAVDVDSTRKVNVSPPPVVDTTGPTISSVTFYGTPTGGTYKADEQIKVVVTFNENVVVVTTDGTPQIAVTIGSSDKQADYQSGSGSNILIFSYTVASGDTDNDGIEIEADKFNLNSGTIQDEAGNDAVLSYSPVSASSHKVDTTAPTITRVAFHGSSPTGGIYKTNDVIKVAVTFSEGVDAEVSETSDGTPYIMVKIGSTDRQAGYESGSGNNIFIFSYTVQSGDSDADGIEIEADKFNLNGGTISDDAGNNLANTSSPSVAADSNRKVDAVAPKITDVAFRGSIPASNTYIHPDGIFVLVTFSEKVTVTIPRNGQPPQIAVKIGSEERQAVYFAPSTLSNEHTFSYPQVVQGDKDEDGIEIEANTFNLNDGTIADVAGNDLVDTSSPAVEVDSTRKVNSEIKVPLVFHDANNDNKIHLSAKLVDGADAKASGATWVNDHNVRSGTTNYGVKVAAAADKEFTLNSDASGIAEGTIYSAELFTYTDDEKNKQSVGEPVADVFQINRDTGTITLKAANKGGRYIITETLPASRGYTETSGTYTLWVMVDSPLKLPWGRKLSWHLLTEEHEDNQSGGTVYASKNEIFRDKWTLNSDDVITAKWISLSGSKTFAVGDWFVFGFTKAKVEDQGAISYAQKLPASSDLSVEANTGKVTLNVLRAAFGATVTVDVTKAQWEYFKQSTKSYEVRK